jgi:hypothetical protein
MGTLVPNVWRTVESKEHEVINLASHLPNGAAGQREDSR